MPNPVDTVASVSSAIEKLCDVLALWISGQDKRKLRAGVDLADRIFKRYMVVTKEDNRDQIMIKWINQFYDRIT